MASSERFVLDRVWPDPRPEIRKAVVDFWLLERALDTVAASERAKQLVVVARRPDGQVAGVSTAVKRLVRSLGFPCFYFRMFVGKNDRVQGLHVSGLLVDLYVESFHTLNQRFQAGIDTDVLGLYMELENRSFDRHRRLAVWTDRGMNVVYIGQTAEGREVRMSYFDGALLPRR